MNPEQVNELIYQALETELGGVEVYSVALECVQNHDLEKEWKRYHQQTQHHVEVLREVCEALSLDPDEETPGREVVRHKAQALISAMELAKGGSPEAAELVAAECVIDAETKDHQNWELIGEVAKKAKGELAKALKKAHSEVEEEEDEHLYHTMGYCRELWLKSLGLRAELPPPEEKKHVTTAIGAARAKQARSSAHR